ncbi:MAG: PEP-CTERM sorting domain-containing protein [Syntrophobacterales bacterium]|jgi:hypothetical protein|nr:PEP-CTERM sorting domain-containing protein [Syntrophobacterales bacterium]
MRTWVKLSKVGWLVVLGLIVGGLLAAPAGATLYQFDMDSDQDHTGVYYTEAGYTSVKVTTLVNPPTQLYGWVTSPAGTPAPTGQRDRGVITGNPQSDLLRDFHFDSADRTFEMAFGAGTYDVTLYFRDKTSSHDTIQVFADGSLAASVDSLPINTTAIRSFSVSNTDGALDLRFHNNAGTDPNWIINGIVVDFTPVPLPSTMLLLGSGLVGLGLLRRKWSLKR